MQEKVKGLARNCSIPSREELSVKLTAMHRRAQRAEACIKKARWWLKAVRGDRSLILNEEFAKQALIELERAEK